MPWTFSLFSSDSSRSRSLFSSDSSQSRSPAPVVDRSTTLPAPCLAGAPTDLPSSPSTPTEPLSACPGMKQEGQATSSSIHEEAISTMAARQVIGGLSLSLAGGAIITGVHALRRSSISQVFWMRRRMRRQFPKPSNKARVFHVNTRPQTNTYISLLRNRSSLPLVVEGCQGSGKTLSLQEALAEQDHRGVILDCHALPMQNGSDFLRHFYRACGFYSAPRLWRELQVLKPRQADAKERRRYDSEAASQHLVQALQTTRRSRPPILCIENAESIAPFLDDSDIGQFLELCTFLADNKLALVIFVCRPSFSARLQHERPLFARVVRFPDLDQEVIQRALLDLWEAMPTLQERLTASEWETLVMNIQTSLGANLSDLHVCLQAVQASMQLPNSVQIKASAEEPDLRNSSSVVRNAVHTSLEEIVEIASQPVEQAFRVRLSDLDKDSCTKKLKRLLRFWRALDMVAKSNTVERQQIVSEVFRDNLEELHELIEQGIFRFACVLSEGASAPISDIASVSVVPTTPATRIAMQRLVQSQECKAIVSKCERTLVHRENSRREDLLQRRASLHALMQRGHNENTTDSEQLWLRRESTLVLDELAEVRRRRDCLDAAQMELKLTFLH